MIWENVLLGAIGGAAVGLGGFLRKKDRQFDLQKIAPTVIVSTIFGGIAGYQNINLSAVEGAAYAGFVSTMVTNLWKAFWRRIAPKKKKRR